MFKRIKRYLVFLCVFAFATTNITDFDTFYDDGSVDAASVENVSAAIESANVESDVELKDSSEASQIQESNKTDYTNAGTIEYTCCKAEDIEDALPDLLDSDEESIQEQEQEEDLQDTSLKTVSYYIHTYKKLPPVYITKKEAFDLGGTLEEVMNRNSIGGDYFGNYQGLLPRKEGRSYRECDIDTLGTDSRGSKRLVYSNDGLMYYTDDHYATFTLLYSHWDNTKLQIL